MKESVEIIAEKIVKLPPELKNIMFFVMENIDFVNGLIESEEIPSEEIGQLIERAYQSKDYLMWAILKVKKEYDEERQENCQDEE